MVGLDPTNLQIWYDKGLEDLRYDYKLNDGDLIIDLGAFEGEWTQRMVNTYRVKAICVEPTKAIRGFGYGEVINAAAATYNGVIKLGGDRFATSAFGDNPVEYPCVDIAGLIANYDRIAVLKCNTEGSEYALLEHLADYGLLDRIDHIQVQFHTISNRPYEQWYNEVAERLSKTHELTWRYPFCWEAWSRKQ